MIPEDKKQERQEMKRLAKKMQNKKFYEHQKENMKECPVCACLVLPSYWNRHIETKRHKTWEKNKKSQSNI